PGSSRWPTRGIKAPGPASSSPRTEDATSPSPRSRPTARTPSSADPANAQTPSSRAGESSASSAAAPARPATSSRPSPSYRTTRSPEDEKGSVHRLGVTFTKRGRPTLQLSHPRPKIRDQAAIGLLRLTGSGRSRRLGMAGALAGGWVEDSFVRLPSADGLRHRVVHLKDQLLGPVRPERGLVLFLHDGERVHDLVDVVSLDSVQVEEGRVQLRPQ